jgi:two-component system, OmpR family, response regulator MprA
MDHVRVLVVDDDAAVRQSLSTALGRDGYEVLAADSGGAALAHLAATSVDAVVLDVAMREPNGLEVCRRLRSRGDRTPILMLTARDLVDDRVAGLDAGADDYLAKPFALAELRARLRALLRRNAASAEQLSHGDLVLDLAAARVTRGGREVPVTRTEYLLLELFLRNPGRVLSHSQIFQAVWGYDFGLRSHNLWVYMSYLRAKLEAAGEPRIPASTRPSSMLPSKPLASPSKSSSRPRALADLSPTSRGRSRSAVWNCSCPMVRWPWVSLASSGPSTARTSR